MNQKVQLACKSEVVIVPLASLLPVRILSAGLLKTPKYSCIEASIRELGLIEPLVVFPQAQLEGQFMILDGHIRHAILSDLGAKEAKCLIATDDEGFTFNHKINRLTAIQEHFMILKAIKNGVSEERIARALNVDPASIRQKRDLLDGICKEAIHILRGKRTSAVAIRELRKVRPIRQIEIAQLMTASHNYSIGYMKCLVFATPAELQIDAVRDSGPEIMSNDDLARIEQESRVLVRELKAIEGSHGKNVLHLVIITGYLRKLLDNARIVRFLSKGYPDVLEQLQEIVEAGALPENEPGDPSARLT
ncbi:plasmid partitioning protein RepB C-terminal domain-containing protein [Aureliella helgolandensis]|uniref:RepB plasmid partitioning protein n=1 Tax=Aureliella helgolandensis TaxID=2527968 RepID=A0A518GBB3_9BACT|nr:plasmid partitioning protein RepB C-terminal domain-containing protein [Aureliella helgolandensis]QDV25888.1 RepB plasmid partitioning protein [Aureliella helgolandensis]